MVTCYCAHAGRFKDEARHQQRLADMRGRCEALFGGAISGHFRIEHHKRVTCLVCNGTVVPYEAYHIDAIRWVVLLYKFYIVTLMRFVPCVVDAS
jgi:hypothetical protein